MPLYEYECPACGPFEGWQPMAARAAPSPAPAASDPAPRVLSPTAGQVAGARRKGRPEPIVHQRREDAPPAPPRGSPHQHAPARPWMLGH